MQIQHLISFFYIKRDLNVSGLNLHIIYALLIIICSLVLFSINYYLFSNFILASLE